MLSLARSSSSAVTGSVTMRWISARIAVVAFWLDSDLVIVNAANRPGYRQPVPGMLPTE